MAIDRSNTIPQRTILWVEQLEPRDVPATISVSTHLDNNVRDNDISLREAVLLANGDLNINQLMQNEKAHIQGVPAKNQADSVHFNLSDSKNPITLQSVLPVITDQITIDGFTQPGAGSNTAGFGQVRNAIYKIEIVGIPGAVTPLISIRGGTGSLITGLSLVNHGWVAVEIVTDANIIRDNSIGVNKDGLLDGNGAGISIQSVASNKIVNNLISGNTTQNLASPFGIQINGATAMKNVVQQNYIGTDAAGSNPMPNTDRGIHILGGANNNTIGGSTAEGNGNLISGNNGSGIEIDGFSNNNKIQGNMIGTDRTGREDVGNALHGILITDSFDNLIGGSTAGFENLIGGNAVDGIRLEKLGKTGLVIGNIVQGNLIGIDIDGAFAIPNDSNGITLRAAGNANKGNFIGGLTSTKGLAPGNIISGNGLHGVYIVGEGTEGTNNLIQGNLIGTDLSGGAGRGNKGAGIYLENTSDNIIGGAQTTLGNVISDNSNSGIHIEGGFDNTVQNNYVGVNRGGVLPLGNNGDGIFLNLTKENKIGSAGAGNVISASSDISPQGNGIHISLGTENVVQANYIGTSFDGKSLIGNARHGILIAGATSNKNLVGGINAGEGNVIGGNGQFGIVVSGDSNSFQGNTIGTNKQGSPIPNRLGAKDDTDAKKTDWGTAKANDFVYNTEGGLELHGENALVGNNTIHSNGGFGIAVLAGQNDSISSNSIYANSGPGILVLAGTSHTITQNSIFNNTGIGIDLSGDGVTLNDFNDADTGPNNLMNFPILTKVEAIPGGGTYIEGTIDSDTQYAAYPITIEFFDNTTPHPSGYGEGEIYLGSVTVSQPGFFSATLPDASNVTATATDNDGNTSEFSGSYPVVEPPIGEPLGTIGNFVWLDSNGDGIQDGGESGMAGVTVQLFDEFNTLIATTTTDTAGWYQFTGIAAGNYYLQFINPSGYDFTLQDQGGDDTLDSDADATGKTALFTLLGGEIKDDLDAGLVLAS